MLFAKFILRDSIRSPEIRIFTSQSWMSELKLDQLIDVEFFIRNEIVECVITDIYKDLIDNREIIVFEMKRIRSRVVDPCQSLAH